MALAGAGAGAIVRTAMLWRFFLASLPVGASAHKASTRKHATVRRDGAMVYARAGGGTRVAFAFAISNETRS